MLSNCTAGLLFTTTSTESRRRVGSWLLTALIHADPSAIPVICASVSDGDSSEIATMEASLEVQVMLLSR